MALSRHGRGRTAVRDERGLIVCHNDPAAWNLVIGSDPVGLHRLGRRGPETSDVGRRILRSGSGADRTERTECRLGRWDPYCATAACSRRGLRARSPRQGGALPSVVVARIESSYSHLRRRAEAGVQPWRQLWLDGHGDGWRSMLEFARDHAEDWQRDLAV